MLLSIRDATPKQPSLSRNEWIEAAFATLRDRGEDAVQITKLAKQLGVTRGSFYWHFNSRAELMAALLTEWQHRNTGVMINALAKATGLGEGILELFAVWIDHELFDPVLDMAVRDWARKNSTISRKLAAEDEARVEAIAAFFRRHDYEPTEAFIRARIIYFTQISYYGLVADEPIEQRRSYLHAYFLAFTGRHLTPEIEQAYARRLELAAKAIKAEP